MTKTEKLKKSKPLSNQRPFIVLLAPYLMFFFVFTVIPVISAIILSFTDFNMVSVNNIVGFDNYIRMFFEDDIFTIALKNTLICALVSGPVGFILSFVIAWFINEQNRVIRTIVTFIVYSPALAGNIFFIWLYIFSSDSRGFLNDLLLKLGLITDPVEWLSNTDYSFTIVMIVIIWMSFGTGFLSFVSGLKVLNRSYFEAAAIDGLKNRWQELYYVTFPQMGPQLMFGAVMSISGAFAVGSVNQALTGMPSTDYCTHTILLHMTDYATTRFEMGYASAIAVVLFVMMLLFYMIVHKVVSKFSD